MKKGIAKTTSIEMVGTKLVAKVPLHFAHPHIFQKALNSGLISLHSPGTNIAKVGDGYIYSFKLNAHENINTQILNEDKRIRERLCGFIKELKAVRVMMLFLNGLTRKELQEIDKELKKDEFGVG